MWRVGDAPLSIFSPGGWGFLPSPFLRPSPRPRDFALVAARRVRLVAAPLVSVCSVPLAVASAVAVPRLVALVLSLVLRWVGFRAAGCGAGPFLCCCCRLLPFGLAVSGAVMAAPQFASYVVWVFVPALLWFKVAAGAGPGLVCSRSRSPPPAPAGGVSQVQSPLLVCCKLSPLPI
jgi:hypothetical protein